MIKWQTTTKEEINGTILELPRKTEICFIYICIYMTEREIYYQELPHRITEAEKSPDLHQQVVYRGEPKMQVEFHFQSQQDKNQEEPMVQFKTKERKRLIFQLKAVRQEKFPFICSFQVYICVNEAHLHQRGQSAFLSLLIQMLILSGNIATDRPRIMFDQMSGHLRPSEDDTELIITTLPLVNLAPIPISLNCVRKTVTES